MDGGRLNAAVQTNRHPFQLACIVLLLGHGAPALASDTTHTTQREQPMSTRPRLRDLGVTVGIFPIGKHNGITDVEGVRVGHTTVVQGENIRTGVTAILPHAGNLFQRKVPAGIHVGNGFGKLIGYTQVEELGEIETPILLTATLNSFRAADAIVDYTLAQPGNEEVRSLNAIVGETNDGQLNDIRGRHVTREHCLLAIEKATTGAVEEGCVGAGTGTIAFGFKGGIGTASRVLPKSLGGHTVGVLVQSNYGGVLSIAGAPVGQELKRFSYRRQLQENAADDDSDDRGDGSIMMIVATDAPLDARNLKRLGARAMMGLARTGSSMSNGSGDYAIAFSTAWSPSDSDHPRLVPNDKMSPLFLAVIEATEEAIYNSMLKARSTTSNGKTVKALPVEEVQDILRKYGQVKE